MIRLSRTELIEIAHVLIVANTPLSLIRGLQKAAAMQKLRQCSPETLSLYYDRVTARRQTEITVALAYATLIAFSAKGRGAQALSLDAARLHWGREVIELLRSMPTTNVQVVDAPAVNTTVRIDISHSTPILFGADNLPLIVEG